MDKIKLSAKKMYVTASGSVSRQVILADVMFITGLLLELGLVNAVIASKVSMAAGAIARYLRMRKQSSGSF